MSLPNQLERVSQRTSHPKPSEQGRHMHVQHARTQPEHQAHHDQNLGGRAGLAQRDRVATLQRPGQGEAARGQEVRTEM
jgi:hypothetical protein